ncbi:hypothetical protein X801_06431, partial [Opisthorchis viverrini]
TLIPLHWTSSFPLIALFIDLALAAKVEIKVDRMTITSHLSTKPARRSFLVCCSSVSRGLYFRHSDKWIITPAGEISTPDALLSSDISKKIRRSFFKKDVAVKCMSPFSLIVLVAYKCDFLGSGIFTAAKIYISNSAIYVVHRPKRRKLTTVSFSAIFDIKPRVDQQGVDIHLDNRTCVHNDMVCSVFIPGFRPTIGAESYAVRPFDRMKSMWEAIRPSSKYGLVYSLTNFQRTESAIAFLLNFWNLVRKDKGHFSSPGTKSLHCGLENSGSTGRFSTTSCDARLPVLSSDASPLLLQAPTTISLNSTASLSETGSLDENCQISVSSSGLKSSTNDTRSQLNTTDHEAADLVIRPLSKSNLAFLLLSTMHLYHRLAVFDLHGRPGLTRTSQPQLTEHEYRVGLEFLEEQLIQLVSLMGQLTESLARLTTELRSLDPVGPSIVRQSVTTVARASGHSTPGRSSFASSHSNKNPDHEVTQHSAETPFLRAETTEVLLPQVESLHPDGSTTSLSNGQQMLHGASSGRPKPVACLTESPGWGATWPFSFLPYPFSSSPQRLTMLIAYAILAFLLLSTMHLYHRLAVFDLHGRPGLTRTSQPQLTEHEYRVGLEFLEEQLIQLVSLMGQLTESLARLTTELRSLDPVGDSYAATPSTETGPLT